MIEGEDERNLHPVSLERGRWESKFQVSVAKHFRTG
ncbi:MAG: hypothetical protein ACI8ZN_000233 [Bacteroidia bacterium]|jgi:hypothetical protein